jgi:hypothetical protein
MRIKSTLSIAESTDRVGLVLKVLTGLLITMVATILLLHAATSLEIVQDNKRPARLLAPLYGSDWHAQPSGTFTSRLSTDRSSSPLLDITTTATGLLCWRDFHPLEWQLASLHWSGRAPALPASKLARGTQ